MILHRHHPPSDPSTAQRQPRVSAAPACAWMEEIGPSRGEWQTHDRPAVLLCVEGVLRLRTADRDLLLPAPRVALIPKDLAHQVLAHHPARAIWLHLPPESLADLSFSVFEAPPLLREMAQEAARWGRSPPTNRLTEAFFTTLVNLLPEWRQDHAGVELPTARSPELRRGLDWLLDRLPHPVGPADAAKQAGLSLRTFQRRCQEEIGLTPTDWLQRARVLRALELLTQPHLNVGEIALLCGYQSQASFGRVFKEHLQLTPLEWRSGRLNALAAK